MANRIDWLPEPEEKDYPAAESYLSLVVDEAEAAEIVERLMNAPMSSFKAKDIFRASELSLLGVSNFHVQKNWHKIAKKIPLSPILLVRATDKLIVADGYHRLCAVYSRSEDEDIPCKIV